MRSRCWPLHCTSPNLFSKRNASAAHMSSELWDTIDDSIVFKASSFDLHSWDICLLLPSQFCQSLCQFSIREKSRSTTWSRNAKTKKSILCRNEIGEKVQGASYSWEPTFFLEFSPSWFALCQFCGNFPFCLVFTCRILCAETSYSSNIFAPQFVLRIFRYCAQTVKSNAIIGDSFQPTLTQHMANIHQNQTRVRASVNPTSHLCYYYYYPTKYVEQSGECARFCLSYVYLSHLDRACTLRMWNVALIFSPYQ